jgi:hypothetical protein
MVLSSSHPRLEPGMFSVLPASPPTNPHPLSSVASLSEDMPSSQHKGFELFTPLASEAPRVAWPTHGGTASAIRAATLYLQDDAPSPQALTWLGVGSASAPEGWVAVDARASPDPQEPAQPKASEALWNRTDARLPCRDLQRQQREVKTRMAATELEIQNLVQEVKEASEYRKRIEREVIMLQRKAVHDKAAAGALQDLHDLFGRATKALAEKESRYQSCLLAVRQQKIDNRALQGKIAAVRSMSGHAALFRGRPPSPAARTAGAGHSRTPSRGRRGGGREGMRDAGLQLDTRRSPSPAIKLPGSDAGAATPPTRVQSPASPGDSDMSTTRSVRSSSVRSMSGHAALFRGRPPSPAARTAGAGHSRTPSRGRRGGGQEGMRDAGLQLDTRRSPSPAIKLPGSDAGAATPLTRVQSPASPGDMSTTRSVRSSSVRRSQSRGRRGDAQDSPRSEPSRIVGDDARTSHTLPKGGSFKGPVADRKLLPAPRLPGFASRPVDEILRRRPPMRD